MVAPGLRITAVSPDGCVEGIESEDGLLHGIQWHPEKMHAEGAAVPMLGVFEQLVAEAVRPCLPSSHAVTQNVQTFVCASLARCTWMITRGDLRVAGGERGGCGGRGAGGGCGQRG